MSKEPITEEVRESAELPGATLQRARNQSNKQSELEELLRLLIQGEKEIAEGNGFSVDSVMKEADLILDEGASLPVPASDARRVS
jgi:hypothetical protein